MLFKINKAMALRYPEGLANLEAPLPPELKKIIRSGLVEVDGCVCLKTMVEVPHTGFKHFPDRTGYECFVNHLHTDDYVCTNTTAIGVSFLREVASMLRQHFPERKFRCIIGVNEFDEDILQSQDFRGRDKTSCTVRFHTLRDGEIWLDDDLDLYKEEGIGVCDL